MHTLLAGNTFLALASAVLWGGSDFCGGMAVKRAGGGLGAGLRVVLLSHATSFIVLAAIAHGLGDSFPHGALLAWGVAAGVAGGGALIAFYIALSRGAMGASAAVSGLLAAAIPAALTLWRVGSPGALPLLGFAVAATAIWLIAASSSAKQATTPATEQAGDRVGDRAASTTCSAGEGSAQCAVAPPVAGARAGRQTMVLAMLAGVGFGVYFIGLKMAGPEGVIWPLATARIGSLGLCSAMLLVLGLRSRPAETGAARVRLNRKAVGWTLAAALIDTLGNLLFVAATRTGRLDVASVLASLYPASTILLAALALGEWPTRRQALGMATAAVAVVLIAL